MDDLLADVANSASQDFFGGSIALRGKSLAIGAELRGAGQVYMFSQLSDGTWLEFNAVTPPTDEKRLYFGCAVSMYDGDLFVGASQANNNSGAVYKWVLCICYMLGPMQPNSD